MMGLPDDAKVVSFILSSRAGENREMEVDPKNKQPASDKMEIGFRVLFFTYFHFCVYL